MTLVKSYRIQDAGRNYCVEHDKKNPHTENVTEKTHIVYANKQSPVGKRGLMESTNKYVKYDEIMMVQVKWSLNMLMLSVDKNIY